MEKFMPEVNGHNAAGIVERKHDLSVLIHTVSRAVAEFFRILNNNNFPAYAGRYYKQELC